ncbi:MAG: PorT family protein, partial [Chitinophagaceae bacterium]|nr:PorT family protein [Chitinophagaceae bacterium]
SYTQVPLLFRFHPANSQVALYAGPQVAFLGTAKTKVDNGSDVGISGQLNQTDFGVAFGVAKIPLKSGLTVDVRVYQGFMDVYKAEYDEGLKTRPTLISLTLGYMFARK